MSGTGRRPGSPVYWEDLEEGTVFTTASRTITETDLLVYAGMSGDWNEIHTNEEFAAESPFGTRIVYAPLAVAISFGLMSRLALWEGSGLAILDLNWTFQGPLFIGDTIHVRMTIEGKKETSRPDRGVVIRAIEVVNQNDLVVQRGRIVMLLRRRPPA